MLDEEALSVGGEPGEEEAFLVVGVEGYGLGGH